MNDVSRLQADDGTGKYDSHLDILRRINQLLAQVILASCAENWQGTRVWYSLLSALSREILPYLSPEEQKTLRDARSPPPPIGLAGTEPRKHSEQLRYLYRAHLERWEDCIRSFIAKKGLGLKAHQGHGGLFLGGDQHGR